MKAISLILLYSLSFHLAVSQDNFTNKLVDAALSLTEQDVIYDPPYFSIDYPNGDLPKGKGVCTDVVIRAYRKVDIDLQKEVHEDMRDNFSQYPNHWGLSTTDTNIDHRRVPNLMKFFERHGTVKVLPERRKIINPETLYVGT